MQLRGDCWNAMSSALLVLAASSVCWAVAHALNDEVSVADERPIAYCHPETTGKSNTCRNADYFEDLVYTVQRREQCFAACDDAVDDQIVPVMRTRFLRWLHINTSVMEAPARLRQHQASERRRRDAADADREVSHDRVSARVWDAAVELDKRSKIARTTIFLHFSSAAAFRSAKRRLRGVYRETLASFNGTLYEAVSSLRGALCPTDRARNCSADNSLPSHIRHWPLRHAFPTFVTFAYAPAATLTACRSCIQGLAAFHRLTESYDMLCRQHQRSVISCPPVIVFAAFPVDAYLSVVPQYAVQTHIRATTVSDSKKKSGTSGSVSAGMIVGHRAASLLSDFPVAMSPFSYIMDHVTLVYDFLAFLVMQDVIQLQYLTKEEAQELRAKAEAARIRASQVKNQSSSASKGATSSSMTGEPVDPSHATDSGDTSLPGTSVASAPNESQSENASEGKQAEDDPSPGVVRTVPELLMGLVRTTEAFDMDNEVPTTDFALQERLRVYDHYYRFPPPPLFAADKGEKFVVFDDLVASLCDVLSIAWVGLLLAVLVSMRR